MQDISLVQGIDLAQGIGIAAFFMGASAFLHRDGKRFRLHLMVYQVVLCSHFILMGAQTAALGCGISAVRSFVSTKTQSTTVMAIFIVSLWVLGLPSVVHHYEILTLIGSTVATWALFKQQGIAMRLSMLFSSFCWLTNNILLGSIGGALMETTFIVINLITIFRLVSEQPLGQK